MAVATDLNPGTSPLPSLRLAMSLACTHFRITPAEALHGATMQAARALGIDRGSTAGRETCVPTSRVWKIGHPSELSYWLGGRLAQAVYAGWSQAA